MASGADRDNKECVETQRLTVTVDQYCFTSIQCFCSYKVYDFILLFRCHPEVDFVDIVCTRWTNLYPPHCMFLLNASMKLVSSFCVPVTIQLALVLLFFGLPLLPPPSPA
jgi:hypothetical protein